MQLENHDWTDSGFIGITQTKLENLNLLLWKKKNERFIFMSTVEKESFVIEDYDHTKKKDKSFWEGHNCTVNNINDSSI